MSDDSDHERIARKAHEIWESEGRPHGRDQSHWDQAKEIVALHDSFGDTLLPRETGVVEHEEPTQSVEANGDIPGLTDQGRDDLTDIDREPENTKPSQAVHAPGDTAGHVARPAHDDTPVAEGDDDTDDDLDDEDDSETVAPHVEAGAPTSLDPLPGQRAAGDGSKADKKKVGKKSKKKGRR